MGRMVLFGAVVLGRNGKLEKCERWSVVVILGVQVPGRVDDLKGQAESDQPEDPRPRVGGHSLPA